MLSHICETKWKMVWKIIFWMTLFFILAITWIILRISVRTSCMSLWSIQEGILRAPHCRHKAATLISQDQIAYLSNSFPKAKQLRNETTCDSPWHYLHFTAHYTCINADTCAAHWVTLCVDGPLLNLSSKTVSSFDTFTDSIKSALSRKVSASQIRVPNATKPRNTASESNVAILRMRCPQLVHNRMHPGICWKLQQYLGEELKGQPAKHKEAVNTFQFIITLLTLCVI